MIRLVSVRSASRGTPMASEDESLSEDESFDRAFLIVGRFLHFWAIMEGNLNQLLQKVLRLDGLQGLIVAKNIQLRDKLNIIGASIEVTLLTAGTRAEFQKILVNIGRFSHIRNMCAHDLFGPDTDGIGLVDFHKYQVKGKFAIPKTVWTQQDIDKHHATIQELMDGIDRMRAVLTAAIDLEKLAKRLDDPTMPLPPELDSEGRPIPRPEGFLGYFGPASTPEIAPQIPREPEE